MGPPEDLWAKPCLLAGSILPEVQNYGRAWANHRPKEKGTHGLQGPARPVHPINPNENSD